MSRKFKSQASSARAASAVLGSTAFGSGSPAGFQTVSSPLSYIAELPDFSGLSEPRLVVAFKNLGKKDSTTKAKALEELQEYLDAPTTAEAGVESGLLEAWANLYPRTSIDNSRRVRQLAHSLQGSLAVLSGRRIAPYLPKTIGSWLSGRFDSDRGVSRAVQDGLEKAFTTVDKRKALWKIYKESLLEYAEDAILIQTAQTLSDERTTSPDDAEAKQVRVAGNAIHMFLQLLQSQDVSNAGKRDPKIAALLNSERMWAYAYHADAHLRRSVYGLLSFCIAHYLSELDWTALSTALLSKSLHISQLGSSRQFSEVLLAMTDARPQIWTTDDTAKTSITRRLFQFLKRGSERGPEEYWTNIGQILRKTPMAIWQSKDAAPGKLTSADCSGLLQALHEGVTSPEEPRANAFVAWTTYIDLSFWAVSHVPDAEERDDLLKDHVSPIISQHVTHSVDHSQWSLPPNGAARVCSHFLVSLAEHGHLSLFEKIWYRQVDHFIDSLKLSLPETAKDFRLSQDSVIAQSNRFFVLQTEVRKTLQTKIAESSPLAEAIELANSRLLTSSLDILKTRNGKPYAASSIVATMFPLFGPNVRNESLEAFLQGDLPHLLDSPSFDGLISILFLCRKYSGYSESLKGSVEAALEAPESQRRSDILCRLIQGLNSVELTQNPQLKVFIFQQLDLAVREGGAHWTVVYAVVQNKTLRSTQSLDGHEQLDVEDDLQARILGQLLENLSLESRQGIVLGGLDGVISTSSTAQALLSESFTGALLSKTLVLSDSPDELVAERARHLTSLLKDVLQKSGSSTAATSTTVLIREQFRGIGQSLSIFGLLELARDAFEHSKPEEKAQIARAVLPTADDWSLALAPHMSNPPDQSTPITSPLQAASYIVDNTSRPSTSSPRDAEGFSVALRLAFCVTKLIKSTSVLNYIDEGMIATILEYLPLVLELINDKITVECSNSLWLNTTTEVLEEAADIVSEGRAVIDTWLNSNHHDDWSFPLTIAIDQIWLKQADKTRGTTPEAYHQAQAFVSVMSGCVDTNGAGPYANVFANDLKMIRKSGDLIRSAALVNVLRDSLATSAEGRKLCNELIADATAIENLHFDVATLRPLMLLNILLQGDDGLIESIPTQRVVFLLKNLVHLLTPTSEALGLVSEALKLLYIILPAVRDIYGDHWQQLCGFLEDYWSSTAGLTKHLPALHSSLKLCARLVSLRGDDANEDFLDAWNTSMPRIQTGLVLVLQSFDQPPTGISQPRSVTAEILRRLLFTVDTGFTTGRETLYPLLASQEAPVQSAAYELLHRQIPKDSASKSIDIALEKTVERIPSELLSLIVNAPKSQDQQGYTTPNQLTMNDLRRYLLSWNLVLDHFTNASYVLKEMYVSNIKEIGRLPELLDLVCDYLKITGGRPIDASKFDIKFFKIDSSDSEEKELQWLMAHIYYTCLLCLPGLAKDWFIQQKNRIKSPLESWTQKHFSPLIVAANLLTVTEWATTQDVDDRPIAIKASPKGSDLTASISIDEESPPISLSISLHRAYPLEQAIITSRNRVGVSEKNWQSWLRTFQIIIFSTGSLIEGLVAFRRNVQGALKGQSECAICYSIIGTDMQTPNKKCSTCKNTFHGVCLYRWFKSSNTSTCPLCRNNFNYA